MARLKNRLRPIPGGFRWYQPETRFRTQQWLSFDQNVRSIMAHRMANPAMAKQHNWKLDYEGIAAELDAFNAKICEDAGWRDYIEEGAPLATLPKSSPLSKNQSAASVAARGRAVLAGAISLIELFGPSQKPVAKSLAEERAAICENCPQNQKGDWLNTFTDHAAGILRRTLAVFKDANLTTTKDESLGVCQACECPLRLKVHVGLDFIREKTDQATMKKLDPRCWIEKEKA